MVEVDFLIYAIIWKLLYSELSAIMLDVPEGNYKTKIYTITKKIDFFDKI